MLLDIVFPEGINSFHERVFRIEVTNQMTNIECIAVNHTYDNCLPQTHDSHIVAKLNLVRNRDGVVCPCLSIKETCGLIRAEQ